MKNSKNELNFNFKMLKLYTKVNIFVRVNLNPKVSFLQFK